MQKDEEGSKGIWGKSGRTRGKRKIEEQMRAGQVDVRILEPGHTCFFQQLK